MREIEVKILEINKEEIIKKLEFLNAQIILDDALIEDYNFDFQDNFLKKKKELLRLRKIGKDVYLTHKKNYSIQNNIRKEDEFETNIGNAEQMRIILQGLGFHITSIRQKRRTSYLLEKVRFEIDTYPEIPTYLEIEAPSEYKIKEMLEKLEIPLEKAVPLTGGEVIRKHGKNANHLLFNN